LTQEYILKEQKKREHLLRMSGVKRVKLLSDFYWTLNPKVSREKIMEFMEIDWLKKRYNLILIGPSGVGKTHIASAEFVVALNFLTCLHRIPFFFLRRLILWMLVMTP